jgi:hypothetical protein
MDSLILTVAVSALVSGVVALGIEWVAKPRLEARKEHLLAVYRVRRKLKGNWVRIMMITSKWRNFDPPPGAMNEEELGNLAGEADRQLQELDEMTKTMADNVEVYVGGFTPRRIFGQISPQEAVWRYIVAARAVMLSDSPPSRKFAALQDLTRPIEALLSRRLGRMPGALSALTEILDKYAELGAKAHPAAGEQAHH